MIIAGLQKLTLIDYPGKIAATVFTAGCSFRCPFCHNPELVLAGWQNQGMIAEKDFFSFLRQRQNKLEGICVTGGEPLIQPDILKFIRKIKKLGFSVKLDTNGYRPDILKEIFVEGLADYVAMDIKNSLQNYHKACGINADVKRIQLSVDLIRNSRLGYEFRTTVVPGIHFYKDFDKIGEWLDGCERYVLQKYEDKGKILDENLKAKAKNKKPLDLVKIKKTLGKRIKVIEIR